MAPILKLYKIVIPGQASVFYYAHPNTYQGFTVAQCGVLEALDTEKAVVTHQHAKDLMSNPFLDRVVVYIKKSNGRRTSRSMIIPKALSGNFAIFAQGKPVNTPTGAGIVVSVKDVRHRSRR